ncbi:hypothetical protein Ddye_005325 [Dipteronia dyeriana]|uniref:Putative plant transposon protein domain-containing protein n=1 Tax=Dipteronia dyeriana TaxID=168575 RepID=A0AAD9XGA1_9ROSI|nr:hypothetical protein Ddye_005325 [Dipteronia dyeriana]
MVRGFKVIVSIDDIMDYYSAWLPDDQESLLRMRYGVTWNDIFIRQNVDFANSLLIQPMEFWVTLDFHIKHINLEIELGMWNIFISHLIRPRSHRTTVPFEVATILHCIKKNELINVGSIIRWEIAQLGQRRVERQPLIFPYLIKDLCRRAGVEMGGERLESPPENIRIATRTSLIVERDLTSDRRRTGKKKSSTRAESSRTHQEEPVDMDFE